MKTHAGQTCKLMTTAVQDDRVSKPYYQALVAGLICSFDLFCLHFCLWLSEYTFAFNSGFQIKVELKAHGREILHVLLKFGTMYTTNAHRYHIPKK